MLSEILKKIPPAPLTLRNDERRIFCEMAGKHLKPGQSVYDIGCGDKPFKPFIDSLGCKYIGVDIEDGFYDPGHIDLVGSAYDIPIDSGSADAVLSSQVIEHLEFPEKAFSEASRVLKPGGIFILAFPFIYPLHSVPRDYLRYTEFFINSRLEQNGLEVAEMKRIGGFWYCAGMMTGLYLKSFERGIIAKLKIVKIISYIIKWFFYLVHIVEGAVIKIFKKEPTEYRALWTVNYVYVARKK